MVDFYPCFMISKTLLDGRRWKDDEAITVITEGEGQWQLENAASEKLEMGDREWGDLKYLLSVLHGDKGAALYGSRVKTLVRAVILSYQGTVDTAKRAPLTFQISQGDSCGRLTVYWTPNHWGGIPSYAHTESPDYLWIETEEAKEAWRKTSA